MRVVQEHAGVEVFGGELVIHLDTDGSIRGVTDGSVRDLAVDVTPQYSREDAIEFAVDATGGWARVTSEPRAKPVVLRHEGVDALCWQVDVPQLDGTSDSAAPRVFVDAHDGAIVWSYDNLQSAEPGSANTPYHGPIGFGVNQVLGGAWVLRDDHHGTYSFGNTTTSFFYLASATTEFTGDPTGPDAHFAVGETLRYFHDVHGRSGPNGSWGPTLLEGVITSGVNYGDQVVNAFWDGSNGLLIFGDGDGALAGPLTTLDIGAHELVHAVTQYAANLVYANESGALNESMSDVFAAIMEDRLAIPGTSPWLIGEAAWSPDVGGDALRFMHDPTLDGVSADHYATRFVGTGDNGGVHLNSGIGNLAFQLLVDGGSHPNPGRSVGVVQGIGFDDAGAIWYRALDLYLTPGSGYAQARSATHQAAIDLFGAGSPEATAVLAAWAEVGLFAPDQLVLGQSAALGTWWYTPVTVPANTARLDVAIWGGTGDADLYVRSGAQPTATWFDCRPYMHGNDEACAITSPSAGTWWVGVYAYAAYTGVNLSVKLTPACSPTTPEIDGNGVDENCDGLDAACGVAGGPGCATDLVISELMVRPRDTIRAGTGEYVEITNRSPHAVDLRGAVLRRVGPPNADKAIAKSIVVRPGQAVVLASNVDPYANGGVLGAVDRLSPVTLPDTGGTVELRSGAGGGATVLDRVAYGPAFGSGGVVPRGASLSLDPGQISASANDVATHWCDARSPYGGARGFGTPGRPNDPCDWTLPFEYRYDEDGDGVEGGPGEPHGDTTVRFRFDATRRWFTTGNGGDGAFTRSTGESGQSLEFTYDVTGVTYTGARAYGAACWPGGEIVDLPADFASGSWEPVGCAP